MVRGDQLAVKGWPIYSITRVYIDNFQGGQPSANYTQHLLQAVECVDPLARNGAIMAHLLEGYNYIKYLYISIESIYYA